MTKPRRTKLYAPHGMALDYVKPGKYRFAAWFVEVG